MAAAAAQEYTGKGPRSDQGLSLQQRLASLAKSPAPSFALATLFAVSAPFGFASPQQAAAEAAAKLQRQQQIAQAAASSPGGASSLAARLIASAKNRQAAPVRALPPFWQLAGFAALFATGGYMIDKGDSLNGSGVVTAWSLTYLIFRTIPTLKLLPKSPLSVALSAGVITLGLGVHGSYYFDKTSWQGAIPGLVTDENKAKHGITFERVGSTTSDAKEASLLDRWSKASNEAVNKAETDPLVQKTGEKQGLLHSLTARVFGGSAPTNSSYRDAQQILESLGTSRWANNDKARAVAFLKREAKIDESI